MEFDLKYDARHGGTAVRFSDVVILKNCIVCFGMHPVEYEV